MESLKQNTIIKDRYRLIKSLGEGSFGEVWLAEDMLLNGLHVAIKFYQRTDSEGQAAFTREYTRVQHLHHDNLLTASYFDVWQRRPFLVMDYCSEGATRRYRGKMTENQIWHFVHDVAAGLAYMHAQEPTIIHQDIKPDNVLVHGDGRYVITDFGISRSALSGSGSSESLKSAGTTAYMGPERFTSTPQTIMASDIWSLGASIYELATGDQPFMGPDGYGIGGVAFKLGFEMPQLPSNFSRELNALVQACLAKETWDRPTAKELEDYTNAYLNGVKPKTPWKYRQLQAPPKSPSETKPNLNYDKVKKIILIVILAFLSIGLIWLIANSGYSTQNTDDTQDTLFEVDTLSGLTEKVSHHAMVDPDGNAYYWTGELYNGKPVGIGTIEYPQGDRDGRAEYTGGMYYGKRQDSKATLTYRNGNTYIGSFKYDNFDNGTLTLKSDDGMYFTGDFYDNKPYNGTWYYRNGKEYSKVVDGKEQ